VDNRDEVRTFLTSRRAKVTPEQAGLTPLAHSNRRVPGLRRNEVADLAGVSVDYYARLERGDLGGVSESVLDALSRAVRSSEDEQAHLFDLARAAGPGRRAPRRPGARQVPASVQRILAGMTEVPAFVRNGRLDILAINPVGAAHYAPAIEAAPPGRAPNMARFTFLDARAHDF
jgi:transcriptional regulator with XRE-family HTH domain